MITQQSFGLRGSLDHDIGVKSQDSSWKSPARTEDYALEIID
jgi:hypothetical protein